MTDNNYKNRVTDEKQELYPAGRIVQKTGRQQNDPPEAERYQIIQYCRCQDKQ